MKKIYHLILLALLCGQPVLADIELTTPDGRRVLLHDDRTWEYVASESAEAAQGEAAEAAPAAILVVAQADELESGDCRLGVILQNNLPYKIKNLAVRLTVYKEASLPYDSVTKSFFEIKPTDSQYTNLLFRGVRCSRIHSVKVEDPGRCAMGELDRFSAKPGDCLEFIRVKPSELIDISK